MKPVLGGLRPRERRLALLAAVIIGFWLVVTWLVQPLWEHVSDLRLQVESKTEKLDALRQLLQQAAAIDQEYQALSPYLAAGEADVAPRAFLDALEALSRQTGVDLSLKPRAERTDGSTSRFDVELDVEGRQEGLLGFLDALFGMPRLMAVQRLRVSASPGKEQLLRANIVVEVVSLL